MLPVSCDKKGRGLASARLLWSVGLSRGWPRWLLWAGNSSHSLGRAVFRELDTLHFPSVTSCMAMSLGHVFC